MLTDLGIPQVMCSCSKVIYEIDVMCCNACGDVACYDCATECVHCSLLYCSNCAENEAECIKCHMYALKVKDRKAYLVINGKTHPFRDPDSIIQATDNVDSLKLNLNGKMYKYLYRSLCERGKQRNTFDYFIYFEEVKDSKMFDDNYQNLMQQYEDEYEESGYYGMPFDYYEEERYSDYAHNISWIKGQHGQKIML